MSNNSQYSYFKYLPELDYHFTNYWKARGELTIFHVNTSEIFSFTYIPASFIEMLFNETFPYDHYKYGFREIPLATLPNKIIDRVLCKTKNTRIFVTDSTGDMETSAYPLTQDELGLLDKLFQYRNGYSPEMGDSTSFLDTKLAFYIDKYLKMKVNRDYNWVFSLSSVPITYNNPTLLENLFEIYVLNEAHKEIKSWNTLLDSEQIHLVAIRNRIKITTPMLNAERFTIPEPLPYDLGSVIIYQNGDLLESGDYTLTLDSDSLIVSWSTSGLNVSINDIFIVDYKRGVYTNG